MTYEHLIVKKGPVTTVALNRPEVRNAMSDQTLRELIDCFSGLAKESDLRAVVVRGEGPDFCAGADIQWMRKAGQLPKNEALKDAQLLIDMGRAIETCPVPVIVIAHGNVYGGGLGIVSAADIVIAEENAKLCFSEARLGIIPAAISCFAVPKIGEVNARRYYLTSEVFGAAEAVSMGLAHEVWPASEMETRLEGLVKSIGRCGPNAVRESKAMLLKFRDLDFNGRAKFCVETLVRLRGSAEGQEGLGAFLDKRKPAWIK